MTISETVAETYYVSPAGDDANPGTAQLPFKTFAKGLSTAVARKNANVSVKLVLKDGTYRERATIARIGAGTSDDAEAALIIQAENTGKAIISGSDIWGGWTPEGANWVHNWPHNWGSGPQPGGPALGPVALRREMIFVKNQLYRQVLKLEEMGPGKFYVDETADKAYVQPLEGVNMASDTVEVGIRVSTLSIIGRKNIAVKGLVLQHASTPGAVQLCDPGTPRRTARIS